MHALICYDECMKTNAPQYTIRITDPKLNQAMRQYAKKHGKSINETVLESIKKEVNYKQPTVWQKYAGTIPIDTKTRAEYINMRTVNQKDWQ